MANNFAPTPNLDAEHINNPSSSGGDTWHERYEQQTDSSAIEKGAWLDIP
jgi:hypothetical protein